METTLIIELPPLTVQLPDNKIIIEKEEYEQLVKGQIKGKYYTLSDVLGMLNVSRP